MFLTGPDHVEEPTLEFIDVTVLAVVLHFDGGDVDSIFVGILIVASSLVGLFSGG